MKGVTDASASTNQYFHHRSKPARRRLFETRVRFLPRLNLIAALKLNYRPYFQLRGRRSRRPCVPLPRYVLRHTEGHHYQYIWQKEYIVDRFVLFKAMSKFVRDHSITLDIDCLDVRGSGQAWEEDDGEEVSFQTQQNARIILMNFMPFDSLLWRSRRFWTMSKQPLYQSY